MSDCTELYDSLYETYFKCNNCGKIFMAVKPSQKVCLNCMSRDLSKPSPKEMEQIVEQYFDEGQEGT